MKKALILSLVLMVSLAALATAKKATQDLYRIAEPLFDTKSLPPDLAGYLEPSLSIASADTFHLAWYGFDVGGIPDEMGWTKVDIYDQLDTFWHVADATELDGGYGPFPPLPSPNNQLLPLSGAHTMWCGQDATTESPFCSWDKLPGYGNNWNQTLTAGPLVCDSVTVSYTVYWDTEPAYDGTDFEWSTNGSDWTRFDVGGGFSYTAGRYDGHGPYPGDGGFNSYLAESFGVGPILAGAAVTGEFYLRFHCMSDGAWSSEDGLFPTDGMILLDDITVDRRNADGSLIDSNFEDFETTPVGSHTAGIWVGEAVPGFQHYHALYPGAMVLQEDPCFSVFNGLWGFFDDPNVTNYACHLPDPKPQQGAMAFKNSRDQYMRNEIWSPLIPNVGDGDVYLLAFDAYSDLPLDNLQFYLWHVRNFDAACPSTKWHDAFDLFSDDGLPRQWHHHDNTQLPMFNVSSFIEPTASHVQIALGAADFCNLFCGTFGTGACHSHAPLFDNVHLVRVKLTGPQYAGLHIYDFFQDTFAKDGTTTGHARADIALDIQNYGNPAILPGDSAVVTVSNITTDPMTGTGPSVYAYVAVWPQGQLGKAGANLEAPETRGPVGKRYPFVDTIVHNGVTWYCFRMDSSFTQGGGFLNRYCVDFNDWVLTPCDTVCYVICAKDGMGNQSYLSRAGNGSREFFTTPDLGTALNSPMEFTILPAGGWKRGGDILYVDYADGSMSQFIYDNAFELLSQIHLVDRYDATPGRGNGLGSRVKNVQSQLINCYRKILWDSGSATVAIGDGTLSEKSDDLATLYEFLDTHANNPGVLLSGSNMAEWWGGTLSGQSAADMKSTYMNFTLVDGDHTAAGEPLSPVLTGVAPCFIHAGMPDAFVAYAGCPPLDFDLIDPTGSSVATLRSGGGAGPSYGLQQATANNAMPTSSTARVVLNGFGLSDIRDDALGFPPDRVEHLFDVIVWLANVLPSVDGVPDPPAPFENRLDTNYPNPFNPTTKIHYSIKDAGVVTLRIYNAAGQLVRTLVNDVETPQEGGFTVTWDGKSDAGQAVSSGVYFYKLTATSFSDTRKMVVLK